MSRSLVAIIRCRPMVSFEIKKEEEKNKNVLSNEKIENFVDAKALDSDAFSSVAVGKELHNAQINKVDTEKFRGNVMERKVMEREKSSEIGAGRFVHSRSLLELQSVPVVASSLLPVDLQLDEENDRVSLGRNLYTFDAVLGPASAQHEVYEFVKPLIRSFLNDNGKGAPAIVIAYGQTSVCILFLLK